MQKMISVYSICFNSRKDKPENGSSALADPVSSNSVSSSINYYSFPLLMLSKFSATKPSLSLTRSFEETMAMSSRNTFTV